MARGIGAKPKNKKSRPYLVDGERYSFTYKKNGELLGITKQGANGKFNVAEDINQPKFTTSTAQDAIIDSYNKAKYGSNKNSYKTFADVEYASIEERDDFFNENKKKFANEQFVEEENTDTVVENATPKDNYSSGASEIMSYPLDLNTSQDHFKIMKYKYQRRDVNASKPQLSEQRSTGNRGDVKRGTNLRDVKSNVAGDSVIGSQIGGSVLLPMPKATDVNGVEWGKSELTISGLAAVGLADKLTGSGRLAGKTREEVQADLQAKAEIERGRNQYGSSLQQGASALYAQTVSKIAGFAFGTDLDVDTYLARSGGRVLNPNAEMLFQGPVIRDFNFSFLMIARSQREGNEIRKIIRFLKLGMAPKFRSTTYLKNPDIFTLHYKNGTGDNDELKTVNKFNPGGLALTTMAVDYAPNGYWSAYRDSQPVAVKMDLSFTELRPIYEQDQLETPANSVGY